MAKQLNVNLAFTADTTQAKQQLQQLQQQLNNLTSNTAAKNLPLTRELQEAQNAAANLKVALNSAMNTSTGQLDLSKFNQSLKRAGTDLAQVRSQLVAMGPDGQQAFMQLAQSIISAEVPMRRTSALLSQLGTVLKNTAKWQISSSLLHGFMGAVQGAYSYAQDLNESLNNIRIVTGQSVEEMDKFALKANKAAKALSATTTEYSNAALIYYQQGLSDEEVLKRTDTTLKLANVSRQSAETVSEWMTAIWNNFDNGTRSLESYADTITALGAATASSADEIAEGLEKFSAIAETVGLSYDYATAALATVTSQTRQSADVVGTAFKTLFARLEGLKLGETLEDGVTLNQYSEGLAAVGINILNANGELKDMDTILDQLGSRWDTLSKAQQVALAQTVGGIRQYNQLISLMDNWDSFQQNLTIAQTSEGALQEQADIYAESWEGAQKRVKASAEAIYSNLIDDDFFIDLLNGFSDFLNLLDKLIDGMGGVKGLLLGVSSILLNTFSTQAARGLENMVYNLKSFAGLNEQENIRMRQQAYDLAITPVTATGKDQSEWTHIEKTQSQALKSQLDISMTLQETIKDMTPEQIAITKQLQAQTAEYGKQATLSAEALEKAKENARISGNALYEEGSTFFAGERVEQVMEGMSNRLNLGETIAQKLYEADQAFANGTMKIEEYKKKLLELEAQAKKAELSDTADQIHSRTIGAQDQVLKEDTVRRRASQGAIGGVERTRDFVAQDVEERAAKKLSITRKGQKEETVDRKTIQNYIKDEQKKIKVTNEDIRAQENLEKSTENTISSIKTAQKGYKDWSTTIVQAASSVMSLSFAIQSLGSIGDTWADSTLSTGEKLLQTFMSLGMAIPMVMNGITGLGTAMGITAAMTAVATAAEKGYTKEKRDQAVLTALGITLKEGETAADSSSIAVRYAVAASEAFANGEKRKGILLSIAAKAAKLLEAIGLGGLIPLEYADAAAKGASAAATWALLAPIGLLLLAIGGLVGVIALVVTGFKALSDAYNADAIAAEKAREEAKALADAYGEVKEKYEELKQTIADYKDAQDAIDQLKQGTQEWRDAVSEANLEILNLLDKYPELAQYVQTLEGGRMIIAEEGLAKVLNQEAENVAIMANMSTMANHRANIAENKAKRTDLIRNELTTKDSTTVANAIIDGIIAGGPGIITAMTEDAVETNKMDNFLEQLQEDYNNLGESAFVGLEERLKDLGVSSDDAAQEIRKLIVEQKNLAETEKIIAQQQVDNLLMAQSGFNTKGYTTGMQERARELSDQIVAGKNISADAMHQYSNWNLAWQVPLAMAGPGSMAIGGILDATGAYIETSTELGDDTIKKYLETKGLDSDQYKGINFKGDKVVWKEKGEGDSAEWNKKELSYEALAEFAKQDYLAEHAAEIATAMNNLMATTRTLSLSNNSYEQALASYLAEGDLSMMSPEVYDELKGASADEITRIFNENEAVFKAAGINSAQDLVNGFDEALKTYDPVVAQQNLINKKWADFKAVIAEGAKELEVSESALKTYTEILITENKALEDNIDIAGQSAVAHFRLAKGVEKVRTAIEDNLGILEEGNANSLEYAEALGAVRDAVAETFGMNVSANFVEDNLKTIKSMTEGNVEAFKELQKLIVTDYVVNLQLEDNAKAALQTEIDNLLNEVSGLEVKGKLSLDNKDAIAALNTALENGSTTTEEIQAMFSNMNLAFPDTAVTTYKKPTRTTTFSENEIWDKSGRKIESTRTKSTVTSEVELPWIGDNPPKFKTDASGAYEFNETTGEAIKIEGTGKSNAIGGLTKMAETSQEQLKEALSYDSDAKGETARERKARIKALNDELDRYHEINEVIDDLSKEMSELSKAKDRAFGKDKIKYMQQELDVLEAEAKAQEVLLQQAEDYLEADKQNLLNHNSKVQLDSTTGNILNYEELEREYAQRLADMSKDDANYEKLEEEYQTFKDYAAKYEETYDQVEEARVAANDKANEKIEKQLEMIDYSVEINVEVNDRQIKNLERLLERLDDDAFDGAERVSNMAQQMQQQFDSIADYTSGIKQILGDDYDTYMSGNADAIANLDLTDSQIQQLKDYTDAIMDSEEAILELRENIESQVMTIFETWHDKIEENGRAFEHATSMAESYKNIIDIVGKTRIGIDDAILKDLEDTQLKASQGAMANAKAQMDTTQKALDNAKKSLANASDEDDIKFWEETVKQLDQQLMEDQENFTSSWQEALQVAADNFTAQMDRAFEHLEDNLAGAAKSFDELNSHMERQQTAADRFLDAGKQQYELSKLNRQLQKDLDKTDNIKAQKELLALQQKIEDYQTNGVNISERDLEALQKKYELRLAEIALEEAQNAKTQVRLTRDSQGNFGYVYTTDETKTAEAEQNYEDKLEENRQLAIKQNQELSDMIVQNRQAMVEALRDIRREDYEDEQSYQQALQETARFYQEQEAYLIEETQKAIQRSQEIYNQDYLAYTGWQFNLQTAQQNSYDIMGQNADGWVTEQSDLMNKLGLNIFNGVTSGENGTTGINGLADALGSVDDGSGFFGETAAAASTWQESYSNIMEQAGSDADGFKDTVLNALYGAGGSKTKPADNSVNGSMAAASEKIVELEQTASSKFAAVTSSVDVWQSNYSKKMKLAQDSVDNLTKSLQTLLQQKSPDINVTLNDNGTQKKLEAFNKELNEIAKDRSAKITITTEYEDSNDQLKNKKEDNSFEVDTAGSLKVAAIGNSVKGGLAYKIGDAWYSQASIGMHMIGDEISSKTLGGATGVQTFTATKITAKETDMLGFGKYSTLLNKKGNTALFAAGTYLNEGDSITSITYQGINKNNEPYWAITTGSGKTVYMNLNMLKGMTDYKASFDTGGYTGEWGPEGRLAMLHQKEIVLNAHDTENFLAAIGIVRDISDQIEKNAIAMQYQNQINNYRMTTGNTGTLQQDVHITAEFPNVSDHNEVELALRNLVNDAAQWANRK